VEPKIVPHLKSLIRPLEKVEPKIVPHLKSLIRPLEKVSGAKDCINI
jgi:hypothetical protein